MLAFMYSDFLPIDNTYIGIILGSHFTELGIAFLTIPHSVFIVIDVTNSFILMMILVSAKPHNIYVKSFYIYL